MSALRQYSLLWIGAMVLIVAAVNNKTTDHYTCHRDTSTLTRDYDLPDLWTIPDGIIYIYITDYKINNISNIQTLQMERHKTIGYC